MTTLKLQSEILFNYIKFCNPKLKSQKDIKKFLITSMRIAYRQGVIDEMSRRNRE